MGISYPRKSYGSKNIAWDAFINGLILHQDPKSIPQITRLLLGLPKSNLTSQQAKKLLTFIFKQEDLVPENIIALLAYLKDIGSNHHFCRTAIAAFIEKQLLAEIPAILRSVAIDTKASTDVILKLELAKTTIKGIKDSKNIENHIVPIIEAACFGNPSRAEEIIKTLWETATRHITILEATTDYISKEEVKSWMSVIASKCPNNHKGAISSLFIDLLLSANNNEEIAYSPKTKRPKR